MKAIRAKTNFWAAARRATRRALHFTLALAAGVTLLGGGLSVWVYRSFAADLPSSINVVTDYRPLRASQVLSASGEVIGEFFVEQRVLLPVDQLPVLLRRAFVAAEDQRFYAHGGIDSIGILRAAWANFRAGSVVQGGSTITQQVAKLLILGKERSLARKIREAMLAHRIEQQLSKDQILGVYLNHVYLGHGAYGVAAAASVYFGKQVQDLSHAEAAMLAAMPKAPGRSTPFRDIDRARARQDYVLQQMHKLKFIDQRELAAAHSEPLVLVSHGQALKNVAAPYFVETVRKHVALRHGDEDLLQDGLRIHTTLDMTLQRAAEHAVRAGLQDLERRLGFSGPLAHLEPAEAQRFSRGPPRPLGPGGFSADDPEQSGLLVPDPSAKAVTLDATSPGTQLPVPTARFLAAENHPRRKPQAPAALLSPPAIDPDTAYAAVVLSVQPPSPRKRSATEKHPAPAEYPAHITVASGSLRAQLSADATRKAIAYAGPGGRTIGAGDVLPVYFKPLPQPPLSKKLRGVPPPPQWEAHLSETPQVEGALLALDPRTGHTLAMVGGYDYGRSQFNRAVQARRQIGSVVKPFIYATAMDSDLTPLSIRWDVPVKFRTASGIWAPHNYRPEYLGPLTLRTALAKSINTIAAQLMAELGVSRVISLMRAAGITSALPHQLSLSLGTADLSPRELAYAIAAFANQGRRVNEVSILRVQGNGGEILEAHRPDPAGRPAVVSPETAYIVTHLLQAVAESGTARKAKDLGRPVAGKTGTSTGFRDAWFVGYVPGLLAIVWVGRDDFRPIGHDATGGQVALPIWLDFMRAALNTRALPDPVFAPPPGAMFVRADPETGLPAGPRNPKSRLIPLKRGTLPPAFRGPAHVARFSDPSF